MERTFFASSRKRVNETQQQDIQPALTTLASNQRELREGSVHNPMGILSATSSMHPSSSFFPSAQTALRLWSIYLERVDSCTTLKVLHVPTDEVRVCATIDDLANAQPENLALCFAIFYGAIGTLQPSEAQTLLDGDLVTCQSQYKAGFEQALAEAEILDNPTLTLLCSLTIYLVSLLSTWTSSKGSKRHGRSTKTSLSPHSESTIVVKESGSSTASQSA